MCGLVGVAGDIGKDEVHVFNDLLYIAGLRGSKSTGIATSKSSKGKDFDWVKITAPPLDLIESKRYDTATQWPQRIMIGHTRAPTVGKVSNGNTQPFVFDTVVGAHNGTVRYESVRRLSSEGEFETDSETLVNSLGKIGAVETVKKLDAADAYAVVFFDVTAGTLNMFRNAARTLFYTYDESRTVLFWASEVDMPRLALNRNGMKWDSENVYKVEPGHLLTWVIPSGKEKFKAPEILADLVPPVWPVPKFHNREFRFDDKYGIRDAGDSKQSFKSRIKNGIYEVYDPIGKKYIPSVLNPSGNQTKEAEEYSKKHFLRDGKGIKFYKGFNGETLDRDDYLKRTEDGCAWCTTSAAWPKDGQPDIVRFINKQDHFCWGCMHDDIALDSVGIINK